MPKVNLILFPGQELRELMEKHLEEGKKYPIAASLFFEDDKDKSGFTIRDEITFPANTKVDLSAWVNLNKNEKPILTISIEDFETGYSKNLERAKKKKKSSNTSSGDDDDFPL
jgi:hypothetical protein